MNEVVKHNFRQKTWKAMEFKKKAFLLVFLANRLFVNIPLKPHHFGTMVYWGQEKSHPMNKGFAGARLSSSIFKHIYSL